MNKEKQLLNPILNPNLSGQKHDPDALFHPLHGTVAGFGYEYSHSVYVGETLYHCYSHLSNRDHRVSINDKSLDWSASIGGRGYRKNGAGAEKLIGYLKSKNRRFKLGNVSKKDGITYLNVGNYSGIFNAFLDILRAKNLITAIKFIREFSTTEAGFKILSELYCIPPKNFNRENPAKSMMGLLDAKNFMESIRDGKIVLIKRVYGVLQFCPIDL